MERLLEIIRSDSSDQDKGNTINDLLDEEFVRGLSEEDYFVIVNYCLRLIASPKSQDELGKEATVKIMSKLNSFRRNEFNDISLQVISELISPDMNEPVDILATSKALLTIGFLEDVVSTEFSDSVLKILQRLRGKLSLTVLVDIANVTQSNPKCLPPQQQLQQFCTEIINQVSSLSIPASQVICFMQDVMAVANMVQKIWLTSPGDIVLSCLANIYTLIADSSNNKS
jgi:hypothetical protein